MPFQVQVDLGPLDVCVVVCVRQERMQTCSEHFGASDGSGFQFGSLGAVFCVFWNAEKHAKIILKCSPSGPSRPAGRFGNELYKSGSLDPLKFSRYFFRMIFGRPKRTDFGALRGPFWEAPKIKIFIFWGSQKAPPGGPRRTPPSEKQGLPLEAFDVFFGNLQLGRSCGGGAWAPQKSPWKIILALFWGPKLGPIWSPKMSGK